MSHLLWIILPLFYFPMMIQHYAVFLAWLPFIPGRRPHLVSVLPAVPAALVPEKQWHLVGITQQHFYLWPRQSALSWEENLGVGVALCTSINSVPFILLQAKLPPNLKGQAEYIFIFLFILILSQQCFLLLFLWLMYLLYLSLSEIASTCTFYLLTNLPFVLLSKHLFSIFWLYSLEKISQVCLSAVCNFLFILSKIFNLVTIFFISSESYQIAPSHNRYSVFPVFNDWIFLATKTSLDCWLGNPATWTASETVVLVAGNLVTRPLRYDNDLVVFLNSHS